MTEPAETDDRSALFWFFKGVRGITTLPALILMTSYVGFSAFALESGFTRGEAVAMTLGIWALPAQMILIGSMLGNAHIAAFFLAVTLSSIRMMPMVASVMPDMRTKKTPVALLLFLSHFIAITSWVFATTHLSQVPRQHRVVYFSGFGMTLTFANALIVAVSFGVVSQFPPIVAGALFMLTPVYFIASLWASGRQPVVKLAFVIGAVSGPILALVAPQFDVLLAGIGGGTVAYLIDRVRRKRRDGVMEAAR